MSDFDEFKLYYALADQIILSMTPEQLAEGLRLVFRLMASSSIIRGVGLREALQAEIRDTGGGR